MYDFVAALVLGYDCLRESAVADMDTVSKIAAKASISLLVEPDVPYRLLPLDAFKASRWLGPLIHCCAPMHMALSMADTTSGGRERPVSPCQPYMWRVLVGTV